MRVLWAFNFSFLSLARSAGLLGTWGGHSDGTSATRSGPRSHGHRTGGGGVWLSVLCPARPTGCVNRHRMLSSDGRLPSLQTIYGSRRMSGFRSGFPLALRCPLAPSPLIQPPHRPPPGPKAPSWGALSVDNLLLLVKTQPPRAPAESTRE